MRAIKGVAGLSGPYDFYPLDVDYTINAFGQAPDPALTEPMHFARAGAPPFFLAWGDEDDLVGRRSIESLSRALHDAGSAVEAHIYPGLDHGGTLLALSRPFRGRSHLLTDVLAFVRRVTQAS
jgi:acetyl esterase/lipase